MPMQQSIRLAILYIVSNEIDNEVSIHNAINIQWNLIITATYGPNITGCYIEVVALQTRKCIESHHWDLTRWL